MMDLSIIVPVYNASNTLNETLTSLNLIIKHCKGKLIIVDDGSSDDTVIIVKKWKSKIKDKLLFLHHDENLGGGAARNTGINAAETNYILVCDSDDISDLESVKKLYKTASNHEWGSAHYQYAHYFRKKISKIDSTDDYCKIHNTNKIFLEDAVTNSLLVNFLFKKDNWIKAGGYPEHHGWDTQGFSIRYLMNNPGVLIAPESFYFHRRFYGNFSYYERENLTGKTFLNSWLTVEEMIGKVPDFWFNKVLTSFILSKESSLDIIKRNIKSFNHSIVYNSTTQITDSNFSIFSKGIIEFRESNFLQSFLTLNNLLGNHYQSEIILYAHLRSIFAQNCGNISKSSSITFQFLQNIGKNENTLRTSRLDYLKKAFKIF